jgi:hypothetical protein
MQSLEATELTVEERSLLDSVDRGLEVGLQLQKWMEASNASNGYATRFDLVRVFNRPDKSFGFFGEVPCGGDTIPVMGDVQEMSYDRPKAGSSHWPDQLREFVLHYFLRVTDFRKPQAYVEPARNHGPVRGPADWCPEADSQFGGFGYQQLFYKLSASGEIGKFAEEDRFAIVDLREIGVKYKWILGKVRIFNFNLSFAPWGSDLPSLEVPLNEETFLVLSPDFIVDEDNPAPGVLKRFGVGYALLDKPGDYGLLAYGPGRFGSGFQSIHFQVTEGGSASVRMCFVVNRPKHILNIAIDPVHSGLDLADLLSFGLASPFLTPIRNTVGRLVPRVGGFDPVFTYIAFFNALAGKQIANKWCVSREQLEKRMLVQHFMQHYDMIVNSLLTWRQIPDWLDARGLPEWVIRGIRA